MRMVLQRIVRGAGSLAQPTAAAAVSLIAVTGFTALLGLFFLPAEMKRLRPPHHVSVTHYVPGRADRPGLALCWSIPEIGVAGWQHFLRLQGARLREPFRVPLPDGAEPLSLAAHRATNTVLIGDSNGGLYALDPDVPFRPLLIGRQHAGPVVALAESSDGRFVVSQDAFRLYGWDLTRRKRLWYRADLMTSCFVLRPDEPTAIVGSLHGDLLEIDLATGKTIARLATFPTLLQALALSSDGSRLSIVMADGQLQLVESRSLKVVWSRPANWDNATSRFVAISPCGRWLVTPTPDDSCALAVWNAVTGDQLKCLRGHEGAVLGASFGEGSLLYSFGSDGTVRTWDLTGASALGVASLKSPSHEA
jgi:WD40 repeat protein